MDKATQDILEKVKKLMALGNSPSEAEAASAIAKARELLARHGLSMTDVEAHSPEIVEGVLFEKQRLRSWEAQLIHVVTRATFTQALHVRKGKTSHVLLIGREVNTIAAKDLFEYLHLVVLKLGRANSSKVAHLESFKCGVVQRIGERLKYKEEESQKFDSEKEERSLVPLMDKTAEKENKDFISEKYGKTSTKKSGRRVDAGSYYKGIEAGEKVSLNRQIQKK
ncbi:MAG TPA: DUF2786 domain-containing protein [Treponemataceae bacterium]|nr:DUF2786 domain-containing protein [Treponemataceae bacterium]